MVYIHTHMHMHIHIHTLVNLHHTHMFLVTSSSPLFTFGIQLQFTTHSTYIDAEGPAETTSPTRTKPPKPRRAATPPPPQTPPTTILPSTASSTESWPRWPETSSNCCAPATPGSTRIS